MLPRTQVAAASGSGTVSHKNRLGNTKGSAEPQRFTLCDPVSSVVKNLAEARSPSLFRRFLRPLGQRSQKRTRSRRRRNLSNQRRPERHHASIKLPRAVLILLDRSPV